MHGMGAMRLAFIPDDLDDLDGAEQNPADAAAEESGNATAQDTPHAGTPEGASAGDEAAQAGQSAAQEAPQTDTESTDATANMPAEDSEAQPEATNPEDSAHAGTGHADTAENAVSGDHEAQSGQEAAQDPLHSDTAPTEPTADASEPDISAPDTSATDTSDANTHTADAPQESLHTGADHADADHTDPPLAGIDDHQDMSDTFAADTGNHSFEMLDDLLDEELANSFMNDHIGPLTMDIEDVFLPQTQGEGDADNLHMLGQQNDSLFPMEPENLVDTGDIISLEQPGQGQSGTESPQTQDAGAPSPGTDLMESEADQMAVLQHLTQNGH